MLGYSSLRKIVLFTMILFAWFCLAADFQYGQEEDLLLKARKLYQKGYYDDALTILNQCIEKLRNIVAQKKKVAEAFYLIAKVYYTVVEDEEVKKSLKRVFETYPTFQVEESNLEFKSLVDQLRPVVAESRLDQVQTDDKIQKEVDEQIDPKDTKENRCDFCCNQSGLPSCHPCQWN